MRFAVNGQKVMAAKVMPAEAYFTYVRCAYCTYGVYDKHVRWSWARWSWDIVERKGIAHHHQFSDLNPFVGYLYSTAWLQGILSCAGIIRICVVVVLYTSILISCRVPVLVGT